MPKTTISALDGILRAADLLNAGLSALLADVSEFQSLTLRANALGFDSVSDALDAIADYQAPRQ